MKSANLLRDKKIIVQIEYKVDSSEGKNYRIDGTAYLPIGYTNGVLDREFFVEFQANWDCEAVLSFYGEDYEEDREKNSYYQTGSVRDLVDMSRALMFIHQLLALELKKTETYMYPEDIEYANSFNLLDGCEIEIVE